MDIFTILKKKYNNKKINILGTKYTISIATKKEDKELSDCAGYCSYNNQKVAIRQDLDRFKDKSDEWIMHYIKHIIRHEIIHAFFNESGLMQNSNQVDSAWAQNEEMIDWLAVQTPKIFKLFNELELI